MKTRNEQLSKYNNFYDKSRKLSKRAKLYSIVYRGVKVLKELTLLTCLEFNWTQK